MEFIRGLEVILILIGLRRMYKLLSDYNMIFECDCREGELGFVVVKYFGEF